MVGLVDVDGHNFPNLALMKISAYYKSCGCKVKFANPLDSYDKIFMSKVFTGTPDDLYVYNTKKNIQGWHGIWGL